jgi:hypothetical protein
MWVPTNLKPEARPYAIAFGLAILVALLMAPTLQKSESTTPVDEVQALLARCTDARNCVGGFIRTKKGYTFRIELCGESCGQLSMSPWSTYGQQLLYRDGIVNVVLPRDPAWNSAAMFYAEQFVDPSQLGKH